MTDKEKMDDYLDQLASINPGMKLMDALVTASRPGSDWKTSDKIMQLRKEQLFRSGLQPNKFLFYTNTLPGNPAAFAEKIAGRFPPEVEVIGLPGGFCEPENAQRPLYHPEFNAVYLGVKKTSG